VVPYVHWSRSLHVVVVIDDANAEERLITVYEPSTERWSDDFRGRLMRCETCDQADRVAVHRAKMVERDGRVAVVTGATTSPEGPCGQLGVATGHWNRQAGSPSDEQHKYALRTMSTDVPPEALGLSNGGRHHLWRLVGGAQPSI
jgi:hypothetical protein